MNIEVELSYLRLERNDLREERNQWRTLALFTLVVLVVIIGLVAGGVL